MTELYVFWAIATGLSVAVVALMLIALLRRSDVEEADDHDVQVYRDQLSEIDRDLARGVVTEDEAARIRLEVSRRLLDADKALTSARVETNAGDIVEKLTATVVLIAVLAGTMGLYAWLGTPGEADQPMADRIAAAEAMKEDRPSQAEIEARTERLFSPPPGASADFMALMERLRVAVAENPDDLQGQTLLAQNEARLGNYRAARPAQEKVLALKGAEATPAEHAALIDLLVLSADGYVSPEAEAKIEDVLAMDARSGTARYYKGLMHAQFARPDLAFEVWNTLLNESSIRAPWVPPILSQIEDVASGAGANFNIPPRFLQAAAQPSTALPGPTAEDMEAAGEMDVEDRQAMIRSMVDGLAERLAAEGGRAEEWARLINALGVLGETERAGNIWKEAEQAFSAYPDQLDIIKAAAINAGVAQ